MSVLNQVWTAAAVVTLVASVYSDDLTGSGVDMALSSCPQGEVPDGLGGCVACSTCVRYPDSPYCTQCGDTGEVTGATDPWRVGVGVGVPSLLLLVLLIVAVLYWRRRKRLQGPPVTVKAMEETGRESSIIVQEEDPSTGSDDVADTVPSTVYVAQQHQPSGEQSLLIPDDENATVPK